METLLPSARRFQPAEREVDSSAAQTPSETSGGAKVLMIPLSSIRPNPDQPRKRFDQGTIQDLASSIKSHGIIQPLVVRQAGPKIYELIAGERRMQAAATAGLAEVPAILRQAEESSRLQLALIENLQREELNPVDEARAFKRLSEEYKMSHDQIALQVGRSRSSITNSLRLLTLHPSILQALEEGKITPGQARPLIGMDETKSLELFSKVMSDSLSSRKIERISKKSTHKDVDGADAKDSIRKGGVQFSDIESRLMRKMGRKVSVLGSESRGFLRIDYYTREDLIVLIDQLLQER